MYFNYPFFLILKDIKMKLNSQNLIQYVKYIIQYLEDIVKSVK